MQTAPVYARLARCTKGEFIGWATGQLFQLQPLLQQAVQSTDQPQHRTVMKLGSLKEGGRDGSLIVVARDLLTAVRATGIAPTLQRALEDWSNVAPRLNALSASLNEGSADGVFDLDLQALAAPLPRAYEFVDGSAYLPHVERVRRARNA